MCPPADLDRIVSKKLYSRVTAMSDSKKSDFEQLSQEAQPSLMVEFIDFLKHNKKWWLLPILLVVGGVGLLAFFSSTGAAPFIYTLF